MNNLLKRYIPMVYFLGEAMGDNCEVVLHDLTDPENAIIAISNGYISGRKVGGPTTDLVLKVLKEGSKKEKDFIVNYAAKVSNNNICRSSSFFIRDENEKIVGVLCVNVDVSAYVETRKMLNKLIQCEVEEDSKNLSPDVIEVFENLHATIDDVLGALIDNVLNKYAIPPARMSLEEKMAVVKQLSDNGLFLLKGGISELAKRMQISEPTIYRYLNKMKE